MAALTGRRIRQISKSGVVEDMVASNPVLYPDGHGPDHCIVIQYVPYVGDSKRAMDEYTSGTEIASRRSPVRFPSLARFFGMGLLLVLVLFGNCGVIVTVWRLI